jgi:hypothetical protein
MPRNALDPDYGTLPGRPPDEGGGKVSNLARSIPCRVPGDVQRLLERPPVPARESGRRHRTLDPPSVSHLQGHAVGEPESNDDEVCVLVDLPNVGGLKQVTRQDVPDEDLVPTHVDPAGKQPDGEQDPDHQDQNREQQARLCHGTGYDAVNHVTRRQQRHHRNQTAELAGRHDPPKRVPTNTSRLGSDRAITMNRPFRCQAQLLEQSSYAPPLHGRRICPQMRLRGSSANAAIRDYQKPSKRP